MKIFVVNCGSSSIKYQLFDMTNESVLAKGLMERVGSDQALLHGKNASGESVERQVVAPDHGAGLKLIIDALVDPTVGVIKRIEEIDGVGHRVVHGGEKVNQPCLIDQATIDLVRRNIPLAPLHMPANLAGIMAAMAAVPKAPGVAVFDTAFLASLPPRAYRYAVPDSWYTKHQVRRYGFHGTSHAYVTQRTAELLGKSVDNVNLITAHLGNGCSMTAVANGKAVDHSMGLTPLEGLVMGTRSGDIDPAVIFYMASQGLSLADIDKVLNKQSGLLGVSGLSNDMRDLLTAEAGGNKNATLALELFVYRVVKYIGSYYAILPGLDAVVLTGGVGENSVPIRQRICNQLGRLGVVTDEARNQQTVRGKQGPITADGSPTPVWVVPTNEELMIARDTLAVVRGKP